jgi:hypothetical protein
MAARCVWLGSLACGRFSLFVNGFFFLGRMLMAQQAIIDVDSPLGMMHAPKSPRSRASVEPFDAGPDGRLHLVRVNTRTLMVCRKTPCSGSREQGATLLEPTSFPRSPTRSNTPDEYDALIRATRWSAITPFLRRMVQGTFEAADLFAISWRDPSG